MALASAVGSFFASRSQNRNARRAAEVSERNNAANVALARDIYGQNRQILSPFVGRGNVAGDAINALLGLGGQNMGGPASVGPNALSQFTPAGGGQLNDSDMAQIMRGVFSEVGLPYGVGDGVVTTGTMDGGVATATGPTATQLPTPMTAQQAQNQAFENFRNSTGYQFRVNEAQNALNSGFAGSGLLQSGAALRSLDELRQNMASAEFNNYLAALSGQQAVGAGSASSLAGVGQNFAGTVIGANNLNAQNQMAARLGQQNPFANALGTWGGAMQNVLGAAAGGGFG